MSKETDYRFRLGMALKPRNTHCMCALQQSTKKVREDIAMYLRFSEKYMCTLVLRSQKATDAWRNMFYKID